MQNKLQITPNEINNIENFNLPLLQEAMRQVELKVQDENSRKTRIDQRAYSLLTLCLGLITLIFGVVNSEFLQNSANTILGIAGGGLCISTILLFLTLKSKSYSSLGTMPHTWLVKEYVQGSNDNNKVLGYVLSYVLYNYNNLLTSSHESNDNRITLLDFAILFLSLSFLPIIVALFVSIFSFWV